METILRGVRAEVPQPRPSLSTRERRRCAMPGCITILSRFNPSAECYVHAEPRIHTTRVDSRTKGWG